MQLENTETRLSQEDRNDYQNKVFGSRHMDVIHEGLKKLNKNLIFPITMTLDSLTESTPNGKGNLFNKFFNSSFSSKETYEREGVRVNKL